jgi:hypothetical protein
MTGAIRTLMQFGSYRPELHYMRGPGPKWRAKHDLALAPLDGGIGGSGNDNECCAHRQRLPSPMFASSYRGMPTPSTKNADAVRDANNEARRNASLSVNRAESMMRQNFKNWPNTMVAAICAGVLSVVFLLSITTSLIVSSSSSVNAEPPGKGCVAISKGEYQGAYRKNLLLTRFGTYVRTGRLGRYYSWYCR